MHPVNQLHSDQKHLIGLAKTRVARWFDSTNEPNSLRPKLLRGIESIARELPNRANWYEVITVALDEGGGLPIWIDGQRHRAIPCADCLAVSSVVPGWGFGWHKVFKDESVYDSLSWFLHYARQYIHRSNVASILMVVWEEHGQILHPFGSRVMQQRYGPVIPMLSISHALDTAEQIVFTEWGAGSKRSDEALTVSKWIHRNTLDPFIHQAVFHYLRAQDLKANGFDMDSVVAFDCVLQSIAHFLQVRCRLSELPTREQVCEQLQLPSGSVDLAGYVYFLRNNFGAHAGGWRWWDQGEILGEERMTEISQLAGVVLSSAADREPEMRSIEPFPCRWGDWFFKNFEMLWDTLWFEKLDKWSNRERRPENSCS